MATRTRRRLIFCCLIVALTLPVEAVLLQAVSTTDEKTAAYEWAASLSPDSLDRVSDDITNFPLLYRRAIMRVLAPQRRSQVWRWHIARFVNFHPDLSAEALAGLQKMSDLATPENLSAPSADAKLQVKNVGDQLLALLGKEDAQEVLYRLGPRDGTFTSHEPVSLRLSNWVRAKFVALAAATGIACDCTPDWGCDGIFTTCKSSTGCEIDTDWPACGWLWNSDCVGKCKSLYYD